MCQLYCEKCGSMHHSTQWCNDQEDEQGEEMSDRFDELKKNNLKAYQKVQGLICVDKHFLNELYCSGYRAGHHDTVEGAYIDILPQDWDSYFYEEVNDIIEEHIQEEEQDKNEQGESNE